MVYSNEIPGEHPAIGSGGESHVDTANVAGKRATLRRLPQTRLDLAEKLLRAEAERNALRADVDALEAELAAERKRGDVLRTAGAVLREGRDRARRAGAELVEEVTALRLALRLTASIWDNPTLPISVQVAVEQARKVLGLRMNGGVLEPSDRAVTDQQRTQEEKDVQD